MAGVGSFSSNEITNTIEAGLRNKSSVTTDESLTVNATDNSEITAVSGAASVAAAGGEGGGFAGLIGASAANNQVETSTKALIDDSIVKNASEIAGIDGVDGLFLGSDDYLLRSGVEIAQSGGDSQLAEAMSALSRICGPLGKSLVGVGAGAGSFALCIENGATHVVVGGDVGFLAGGSKSAAQNARLALEARETKSAAPDSSSSPLY
jgi:hypothetical protein